MSKFAKQMPTLILHSAPLSGCSGRIRIAALLKGIPLEIKPVCLSDGSHRSSVYTEINPNASVPTLHVKYPEPPGLEFTITQSLAMLEFTEEAFPDSKPLLPAAKDGPGLRDRALVRELAALVACDIQPPQTLRVRDEVLTLSSPEAVTPYVQRVYRRGLSVYERLLARNRAHLRSKETRYSFGGSVSIADVCLIPMVQGAVRSGVDLHEWPMVREIVKSCLLLEAFEEGGLGIEVP